MNRQAVAPGDWTPIAPLVMLARWREHVAFTVAATLLGIAMAAWPHPEVGLSADVLVPTLAGNILAVAFAFMINDLEDAPDDARDSVRRARNAVAAGAIAPHRARLACAATATAALALFALAGEGPLAVGTVTIGLAWLYSWRRVRLKALPLVDVAAHGLMLSALLFLAGYFAVTLELGRAGWAVAGLWWISAYGQLYNQVRDYDQDRAADLHNTASLLGRGRTQRAMVACLAVGVVCFAASAARGTWPPGLALVAAGTLPVFAMRAQTDMRGTPAIDLSGRLQSRAMLAALITAAVWFLACIAR